MKTTEQPPPAEKNDSSKPTIGERQSPDGQEEPKVEGTTSNTCDVKLPLPIEEQEAEVPESLPNSNILPWNYYARKERTVNTPTNVHVETSLKPGEYVMRSLFAEFVLQADKKITAVMAESFVSVC